MNVHRVFERELRVRARRRRFYVWRVLVPLVVLVVLSGMPVLRWGGGVRWGGVVFGVLGWGLVAWGLAYGFLVTYEEILGEAREGTLGLLFLTDLGPGEVVVGKFSAVLVEGVWVGLAVMPVVMLLVLVGGVRGSQVAAVFPAVVVAVVAGAAVGLWVSTWRDGVVERLGLGLGVLVVWALGPMWVISGSLVRWDWYVGSVAVVLGLGVVGLWAASWRLGRWLRLGLVECGGVRSGGVRFDGRREPMDWLAWRDERAGRLFWWAWAVWMVVVLVQGFMRMGGGVWMVRSVPLGVFVVGVGAMLVMATAMTMPLVELRRSGMLETVLTTPGVDAVGLAEAMGRRWWRWVRLQALVVGAVNVGVMWYGWIEFVRLGGAMAGRGVPMGVSLLVSWTVLGVLRPLMEWYAVLWLSLWFAAELRRMHLAGPAAVGVLVLVSVGVSVAWVVVGRLLVGGVWAGFFPEVIDVVADGLVGSVARQCAARGLGVEGRGLSGVWERMRGVVQKVRRWEAD